MMEKNIEEKTKSATVPAETIADVAADSTSTVKETDTNGKVSKPLDRESQVNQHKKRHY